MSQEERKSKTKELEETLLYKPSSLWDHYEASDIEDAYAFNEDYKQFLNQGKTEREVVKVSVSMLEEAGFKA